MRVRYVIQDLMDNKYLSNINGDFHSIVIAKVFETQGDAMAVAINLSKKNKFLTIREIYR